MAEKPTEIKYTDYKVEGDDPWEILQKAIKLLMEEARYNRQLKEYNESLANAGGSLQPTEIPNLVSAQNLGLVEVGEVKTHLANTLANKLENTNISPQFIADMLETDKGLLEAEIKKEKPQPKDTPSLIKLGPEDYQEGLKLEAVKAAATNVADRLILLAEYTQEFQNNNKLDMQNAVFYARVKQATGETNDAVVAAVCANAGVDLNNPDAVEKFIVENAENAIKEHKDKDIENDLSKPKPGEAATTSANSANAPTAAGTQQQPEQQQPEQQQQQNANKPTLKPTPPGIPTS